MNIYHLNIAEARTRPIKLSHFKVRALAKANFIILFFSLKPNLIVENLENPYRRKKKCINFLLDMFRGVNFENSCLDLFVPISSFYGNMESGH